jgi:hypothetical protein
MTPSNLNELVKLRPANENDVGFIFNSWLKSFRKSNFAKNIDNTIYYENHHKLIEKLVKSNPVIVACDSKDETQLFGYICASNSSGILVIHYAYVKHSFRNMGVCKLLLSSFNHSKDVASIYTHHTNASEKLSSKFNSVYHPYLLKD